MKSSSPLHAPNLSGSIEDWLEGQFPCHPQWFRDRPWLLDVGAYHGDFARRMVQGAHSPFRQAVLFEPNPENFSVLRQSFGEDSRYHLENKACADHDGTARLHCQGELYTGSLLAYQSERPGAKSEHDVTVTTLDQVLSAQSGSGRAGLIKIDTQGNDLRVLQGARRLLREARPWVVVEMLATPRFVNQARPVDLIAFLEAENYFLAAQFNEYYTATGWLAWFDACFVPRELFSMDVSANVSRPTVAEARKSGRSLRRRLGRLFPSG